MLESLEHFQTIRNRIAQPYVALDEKYTCAALRGHESHALACIVEAFHAHRHAAWLATTAATCASERGHKRGHARTLPPLKTFPTKLDS